MLMGKETAIRNASRPIGAATLTEAYLKADPPGAEAVQRAALSARSEIISAKEQLYENLSNTGIMPFSGLQLIGTAGTVTTLAGMYIKMERYVPYRVNGVGPDQRVAFPTIESLAHMPLAQREADCGPGAGTGRHNPWRGRYSFRNSLLFWPGTLCCDRCGPDRRPSHRTCGERIGAFRRQRRPTKNGLDMAAAKGIKATILIDPEIIRLGENTWSTRRVLRYPKH